MTPTEAFIYPVVVSDTECSILGNEIACKYFIISFAVKSYDQKKNSAAQ